MQAVLFVCSYNSVRSPMAAAILQELSVQPIYVQSAGVQVRDIDGFAIAVLKEEGKDISAHKGQSLYLLNDRSFDKVIALSAEAYKATKKWAKGYAIEPEYWDITKPEYYNSREETLALFRQIRKQITTRIHASFPTKPQKQ